MKYKTKKINYNSKQFLKGLEKAKREGELSKKRSKPDTSKMYLTFDV